MLDFLTDEERVRLKESDLEIFEKLESSYKTMRENLSKMEAERKSDRVNREQLFNQLEQRFVNLKSESDERERQFAVRIFLKLDFTLTSLQYLYLLLLTH